MVVWAKNSLEHIWYLIITYMCLCFTLCCLLSPVEAILASSEEHDFIIYRSSFNFLSSMFRNSVGCQCEICFLRLSICKEICRIQQQFKIVAICSAGGRIAVEGRPNSFIAVRESLLACIPLLLVHYAPKSVFCR